MSFEEIKLLAQCALADNRQAFGRLVEMHQQRVRRFLVNLTGGDVGLADDLAQETFLQAYTAVRSFRGLSSFSTWLYRIAYREFLGWCRQRREPPVAEIPDIADDDDDGDDRAATLMEAVDRLKEPQHTIVILYYIEDRPTKEIAKILDLPKATVRVYLMRARNKLKNIKTDNND